VSQSGEDLLAADLVLGEVDWFGRTGVRLSRGELAESTVRTSSVVVPQVLGQDPAQMILINDQHPVEDLSAQGTETPLADRVAPHRQLHPIRAIGIDGSG
jgi:hypothetical protein